MDDDYDFESLAEFKSRVQQYSYPRGFGDLTDNDFELIHKLRLSMIGSENNDRRVAAAAALVDGYCSNCGSDRGPCFCLRDD